MVLCFGLYRDTMVVLSANMGVGDCEPRMLMHICCTVLNFCASRHPGCIMCFSRVWFLRDCGVGHCELCTFVFLLEKPNTKVQTVLRALSRISEITSHWPSIEAQRDGIQKQHRMHKKVIFQSRF